MSLYRLVYISSNKISSSPGSFGAQVEQILSVSRRNNAAVGVTGALIFSSGFFGQVLEGPRTAVEATFERIQQDMRHSDVSLLEFKSAVARTFERWDMAYVGQDTATASAWSHGSIDIGKLSAEDLLAKLHALVAREFATDTSSAVR